MFSNLGPEVDLLWLGMGEDGHTLSLFPGHQEINNQSRYVLPVNNAPKPPLERITLGLKALSEVKHCQVLASGSLKKDAYLKVQQKDSNLPMAQVNNYLLKHGCKVQWLVDKELIS